MSKRIVRKRRTARPSHVSRPDILEEIGITETRDRLDHGRYRHGRDVGDDWPYDDNE